MAMASVAATYIGIAGVLCVLDVIIKAFAIVQERRPWVQRAWRLCHRDSNLYQDVKTIVEGKKTFNLLVTVADSL
jgi:hypothetical protein